jgi:hypothetical protein
LIRYSAKGNFTQFIEDHLYVSTDFGLALENSKSESDQVQLLDSLPKHPYKLLVLKKEAYDVVIISIHEAETLRKDSNTAFGTDAWLFSPIAYASSEDSFKDD